MTEKILIGDVLATEAMIVVDVLSAAGVAGECTYWAVLLVKEQEGGEELRGIYSYENSAKILLPE